MIIKYLYSICMRTLTNFLMPKNLYSTGPLCAIQKLVSLFSLYFLCWLDTEIQYLGQGHNASWTWSDTEASCQNWQTENTCFAFLFTRMGKEKKIKDDIDCSSLWSTHKSKGATALTKPSIVHESYLEICTAKLLAKAAWPVYLDSELNF